MFVERTYLVTGGAGFIGSHLMESLSKRYPEEHIVSIDNYHTGTKENHIERPNISYIEGDTNDIKEIWGDNRLPAPKSIYHLGEYARIVQSFEDIDMIWQANVNGTKEVVDFSNKLGSKLIYAASSSKFGNEGEDKNLSPYAWIKASNVELIKNWHRWYGGPDYVITYFFNVYGPKQIMYGKMATVIGIFERQLEEGRPLTVVEPGTQTRDFTHVSDIVEGVIICGENGTGDGYQLGAGREKTILEVAQMFGTEIQMIPAKKGERKSGKATSDKARLLGWEPKIQIEDYIAEVVERVRQHAQSELLPSSVVHS